MIEAARESVELRIWSACCATGEEAYSLAIIVAEAVEAAGYSGKVTIFATDVPRVDVDIERANVRRRCQELFPDKMHVFDLVFESRFQRLWEQFRAA